MSEDTIRRETIAVKRKLTDDEVDDHEQRVHDSHDEERLAKSRLKALEEYAKPRTLATFDPHSPKLDATIDPTSFEEARALNDALEIEKLRRASVVKKIEADRRHSIDAAANGYVYDIHDCRVELDDSGTQVRYVSEPSGEVVHTRVATDEERQLSLPGDEIPTANKNQAPAMVQ